MDLKWKFCTIQVLPKTVSMNYCLQNFGAEKTIVNMSLLTAKNNGHFMLITFMETISSAPLQYADRRDFSFVGNSWIIPYTFKEIVVED